jgi:hypothetical protein
VQPWVSWEPHGRLILAVAACFVLAGGIASTMFARPLTALKWERGNPWNRYLAIGGFEGTVFLAKVMGVIALLIGAALLTLVIHG